MAQKQEFVNDRNLKGQGQGMIISQKWLALVDLGW
jgi:hypothetical protein